MDRKDGFQDEGLFRKEMILSSFCYFDKKTVSLEELLVECFRLLPKEFSLRNYPQWPDARKLGRPLRSLRKEGLVKGDPKNGFSLTSKGQKEVSKITGRIRQKKWRWK